MNAVHKLARAYVRLIETLGVLSIAAVAIVAVLQVYFRYVVGASLYWSEELMRYMTIWSVFLLAGLSYTRGEMMGFSLLVNSLPWMPKQAIKLAVRVVVIVFLLTMAWYGFDFAERTMNDKAIALRVSMFWVHLSVPVGCVLIAIHIAVSQFIPEQDIADDSPSEGQP